MATISMIDAIGEPAMLEMLAEEASELTQAALKASRVLRGENPTPVTAAEALTHLVEEYTDVVQCALELHMQTDLVQMKNKHDRFEERWRREHGKRTL